MTMPFLLPAKKGIVAYRNRKYPMLYRTRTLSTPKMQNYLEFVHNYSKYCYWLLGMTECHSSIITSLMKYMPQSSWTALTTFVRIDLKAKRLY